jgi:NAD(P)-dependent dehydrogenase (short-subunit alcohol dehydrogenase family)
VSRPRTVLITGGTDGIGRQLVDQLAGRDHHVVVHGRNAARVADVAEEARQRYGATVSTAVADLARLDQVRDLADRLRAEFSSLDVLVNNAATVHHGPPTRTVDGYEPAWAVNYLAPSLLTRLLLPLLDQADRPPARVLTVSSNTHAFQPLHPDPNSLQGWPAYAHSKLALVMFGYALARRVQHERIGVRSVDPGSVPTKLSAGVGPRRSSDAAADLARMATDAEPDGPTGSYWVNGAPAVSSGHSRDIARQDRLWRDTALTLGLPVSSPRRSGS